MANKAWVLDGELWVYHRTFDTFHVECFYFGDGGRHESHQEMLGFQRLDWPKNCDFVTGYTLIPRNPFASNEVPLVANRHMGHRIMTGSNATIGPVPTDMMETMNWTWTGADFSEDFSDTQEKVFIHDEKSGLDIASIVGIVSSPIALMILSGCCFMLKRRMASNNNDNARGMGMQTFGAI